MAHKGRGAEEAAKAMNNSVLLLEYVYDIYLKYWKGVRLLDNTYNAFLKRMKAPQHLFFPLCRRNWLFSCYIEDENEAFIIGGPSAQNAVAGPSSEWRLASMVIEQMLSLLSPTRKKLYCGTDNSDSRPLRCPSARISRQSIGMKYGNVPYVPTLLYEHFGFFV